MSLRQKSSTTSLPQTLLDEIEARNADDKSSARRQRSHSKVVVGRKQTRQLERQLLKKRKADFFSRPTNQTSFTPELVPKSECPGPQRKKRKLAEEHADLETAALAVPQVEMGAPSMTTMEASNKQTSLRKLTSERSLPRAPHSFTPRSRQEREEEAYIAALEAKLGVNKRAKGRDRYGSAFAGDGLMDLLVDLDSQGTGEGSEHLDDRPDGHLADEDSARGDTEDETTNFEHLESKSNDRVSREESLPPTIMQVIEPPHSDVNKPSESRYVPPQLRKQRPDNIDELADLRKLSRQLKGSLNRLSEQNIITILKDIEGVYQTHRRHAVTTTLTDLIIEGTCLHSALLDSYVALHAGLVACLYKINGVEFAAFFVQKVVFSYEVHYAKVGSGNVEDIPAVASEGKECSNLIVLLTELYNFQVISCLLMYDLIRGLLDGELRELDVELLLKIIRSSGPQLRQDDPNALKDIIQIVQSKITSQGGSPGSRTLFMVETLTNIKNNKFKRQNAQSTGVETIERLKKLIAGLGKKHHVLAHEPLRVSLEDLRLADSKGKWWLVGAAWHGDPLTDRQDTVQTSQRLTSNETQSALMKLARKHGMNTDVRRSIFIVLMSSDDYVDACERLTQLTLTEVQQREIIRVLLHCCGNEKSYNPYYTLVGQHLCRLSHGHKITLQFCLWDFLRSLGQTEVGGADMLKGSLGEDSVNAGFDLKRLSTSRMTNVAKAYAWWLAKDSINMTVLKPVKFVSLKPQTREFFKLLFIHLFIGTQSTTLISSTNLRSAVSTRNRRALEEVMQKAARIPALAEGIIYFISTVFRLVGDEDGELSKLMSWACGMTEDVLRSGQDMAIT